MIDEMSGSTLPFNLFKTIVHQGVVITNVKNDTCPLAAEFIGVTSNYWLEHWWSAHKVAATEDTCGSGEINYHAIWRVVDEIRIYHAWRRRPKNGEPWNCESNNIKLKRNEEEDGDGSMIREAAITVYTDKIEGFYNRSKFVPPPEKPIIPPAPKLMAVRSAAAGPRIMTHGSASGTTTLRADGTN